MAQNWDDLRLFLAVAREQSLSGAGKLLRLDPATLGRRMARLENDMQAALFLKSPQGYALTEAGAKLLVRAELAEQAMRAATAGTVTTDNQLTGQVRIGAPDGCANYLLPQVCVGLMAAHPGLDIQIVALPRVFNLSRREADMAIGVSAPSAGRLTVKKITDYHLHLAASAAYLARHGAIEAVADLHRHQIVGYIPDMIFDRELDYLADLAVPRVAVASNSVAVQIRMIAEGAGVGVAHDFSLPAHPGVRRILTDDVSLTRAFYLIRHEDDLRNARLTRIAQELADGVRGEVARLETLVTKP